MMLVSLLIYWGIVSLAHSLPGAKGYRNSGEVAKNGVQPEPTCEQLKEMWRFSKRQSRAAELTNELPMYPDPFAENIWQPFFATSRSIGGRRVPVAFGKIAYGPTKNKINPEHLMPYLQQYGMQLSQPRRRPTTSFRLPGGGHIRGYPSQMGSFNQLKELIRTERARELQQQRRVEESVARAAAEKDLARNLPRYTTTEHVSYELLEPREVMYSADMPDIQEMGEPIPEGDKINPKALIPFPNIYDGSDPSAKHVEHMARFASEYDPSESVRRSGRRAQTDSFLVPNSFRVSRRSTLTQTNLFGTI